MQGAESARLLCQQITNAASAAQLAKPKKIDPAAMQPQKTGKQPPP